MKVFMMNQKRLIACFAVFILSISSLLGANKYIASRIAYVKTPPKIDGTIKKSEWKSAAVLASFSNTVGRLAPQQGKVMVAYDNECLYFGFRSVIDWEPEIIPLKFDSMSIGTVDSIDIAVIPNPARRNHVMRFVFERGGGKADMRAIGQVRQPPHLWNPKWQVACRLLPQSYLSAYVWEAEVAIPWKSLEIAAPAPGVQIPVQIIRCMGNIRRDSGIDADRVITWAPVPKGRDWINPSDFGLFHFAGDKPVFQANSREFFGVSGKLSSPDDATLVGLAWEIGRSSSPLKKVKRKVKAVEVHWPKGIKVKRARNCMLYWILEDEAGRIGAGKYITTIYPPFKVKAGVAHALKRVTLLGDLRSLKIPKGYKVVSKLMNLKGKVMAINTKLLVPGATHFEAILPLKGIPAGASGIVRADLINAQNKVLYSSKHRVKVVATPPWMGKNFGAVNEPPPCWEAVKVMDRKAGIDVKILDNTYKIGKTSPLPETIKLRGKTFLTGPMRFEANTTNGLQDFAATVPPKIINRNKRGVTLIWNGKSKDLTLAAKIRIEFDGLAWYDVKLMANHQNIKIQSLAIVLPVQPQQVRYMRASNVMNVREPVKYAALVGQARTCHKLPNPAVQQTMEFSSNGWKFESCFNNFYWIGGEDRGMFFILPSQRNVEVVNKYTQVTDNKKEFTIRFNLIDRPLTVKNSLKYNFGLMLTPSKRIGNKTRLWRVGAGWPALNTDATVMGKPKAKVFKGRTGRRFLHDPDLRPFTKNYLTTVMLPCWKLRTPQNGNPTPNKKELEYMDKWLANLKKSIGGSPMLWYDALFSMYHLPQAINYIYDWESYPATRLPVEQLGTYMCPTAAWSDYYLYGAINRMKQGVKSFYMDLTFFKPCSNRFHGCGYWNKSGEIQGVVPFLETREMFLRYQKLVKRNDPNGLLVLHGNAMSPISTWVDVITDGEVWITAPDYSTLTPEYFQATLASSEQLGTVSNFFPAFILLHYIQAQKSKVTLEEVCGMTFSHGESIWNGTEAMMPGLRMVWDILDQFGVGKAEWTPYWRNNLSAYPDGVIVSSWQRGNRKMLVVFNPAYKSQTLNLEKLAGCRIINQLTGKSWSKLKRNIAPRGFKLLLVEKLKKN
jgi:hypothetical protein